MKVEFIAPNYTNNKVKDEDDNPTYSLFHPIEELPNNKNIIKQRLTSLRRWMSLTRIEYWEQQQHTIIYF